MLLGLIRRAWNCVCALWNGPPRSDTESDAESEADFEDAEVRAAEKELLEVQEWLELLQARVDEERVTPAGASGEDPSLVLTLRAQRREGLADLAEDIEHMLRSARRRVDGLVGTLPLPAAPEAPSTRGGYLTYLGIGFLLVQAGRLAQNLLGAAEAGGAAAIGTVAAATTETAATTAAGWTLLGGAAVALTAAAMAGDIAGYFRRRPAAPNETEARGFVQRLRHAEDSLYILRRDIERLPTL